MELLKSATLLSRARDSFAEIRLNVGGVASESEDLVEIDQAGSGEYQVRARLICDPVSPVLLIERFPKPNLASLRISEPEFMPKQGYSRTTRKFEAIADKSTFGWLEKSNDKRLFSSGDIIQIIKQLL